MSVNKRIKQIRKTKGWNQTEFAALLGVTQSGISYMERDGSAVSDQTIKSICMAVPGLNEGWLRTGAEPMFFPETTFSLDQFVKDHGGTDLELEIVKAYFSLPKDVREAVMEHFKAAFSEKIPPGRELTTDECEAEYKKSVLCSAQKKVSSALNTTEDTANKKQA